MPAKKIPKAPKGDAQEEWEEYHQKMKEYADYLEERSKKVDIQEKDAIARATAEQKALDESRAEIEKLQIEQETQADSLKDQQDKFHLEKAEFAKHSAEVAADEAHLNAVRRKLDFEEKDLIARETTLITKEEAVRLEEIRVNKLREALDTAGGEGSKGLDATIILQQQKILERQLKLEELREIREAERDKKEAEKEKLKLATGKGFKPPSFKGLTGERPEAHLLRAEDWMDASNPNMEEEQKIKNFRLTLDHHAREWYDRADCKKTWKALKLGFSRYFSTQGRSVRNLHDRWKAFKFTPYQDDIEEFVRDVQETASQLNYTDVAAADMIKSCMPIEMYTTLYAVTDLDKIITTVKDIYAKPVNKSTTPQDPSATATPSATPFSAMKGVGSDQYMYLQPQGDGRGKPFKPYVTSQGRGRGRGRGGRGRGRGNTQDQQNKFQGRGQFSFRGSWQPRGGRGRGMRFDKSPNVKKARVNTKTPNQDKNRCHNCNEFGHWARECPQKQNNQNNGNQQQNNNHQPPQHKTFPGANYSYMYPAMPQVPMAPVAVPTNPVQMPISQGNTNTAVLGQMQDVMMKLNDVNFQDNPVYMKIEEEEVYLN